jgi:predicted nucleic acid-binding protein
MDTVLVDTSVWINYFKANTTPASLFLKNNTAAIIIATCPVIVQEVLQGIVQDSMFEKTVLYFNSFTKLNGDQHELAINAANLYRTLRTKGITIRKPNDCLIAMYAITNNVVLLHDDRDFDMIAKHSPLKLIPFNN